MASSRTFGSISTDMQDVQVVLSSAALHTVILPRVGPPASIPPNAAISDKKLLQMRVDELRAAIWKHQVSFPSQIPTFSKHTRPDLQRKLVQLYFICGWNGPKIRARYGLSAQRFQQILSTWKRRAVELGFIQTIPPSEALSFGPVRPPIRIFLSPAGNGSSPSVMPPVRRFGGRHRNNHGNGNGNNNGNGNGSANSCRPRSKCDSLQIADVLKRLEAGRSVADMASEVGVTASTIRDWKRQQEILLLQRENKELRGKLAKLAATEKTVRPH
jgi:Transposase